MADRVDRLFAYMAAEKPSRAAMAEFVRLMVFDETLATESLIDERYESSLRAHPELPIPPNFGDLTPDLALDRRPHAARLGAGGPDRSADLGAQDP